MKARITIAIAVCIAVLIGCGERTVRVDKATQANRHDAMSDQERMAKRGK